MLCDSDKFGRISFVEFAGVGDIDRLITDKRVNPKMVTYLKEHNEDLEFISV